MSLTRRQFLAAAAGVGGAALTGGVLADQVWPLLSREDLVPGRTPDRLTFAAPPAVLLGPARIHPRRRPAAHPRPRAARGRPGAAGHDHDHERTIPLEGITYVVSGGGAELTPVRVSRFTAAPASVLRYLHVDVDGDRQTARCIRPDGGLVDRFTLRAREGR